MGGEILHKELSYKIVGILFEVYNELGYGHPERYYERAIEEALKLKGLNFERQKYFSLTFKGRLVGKYYLDFLIEDKIILELKKGNHFSKRNIEQIKGYLQATGLKLAILANFTPTGVKTFRLLNPDNHL